MRFLKYLLVLLLIWSLAAYGADDGGEFDDQDDDSRMAEYYETPDSDLAALGEMMRLKSGGGKEVSDRNTGYLLTFNGEHIGSWQAQKR